jgi:hypothetical protein
MRDEDRTPIELTARPGEGRCVPVADGRAEHVREATLIRNRLDAR